MNAFDKESDGLPRPSGCGCGTGCCGPSAADSAGERSVDEAATKKLNVELLVIDLEVCERCVPTGERLRDAIELVRPAARAVGVAIDYSEVIVQTPQEAMDRALLSSPTIRINGRDVQQDVRESECESCGDLTEGGVKVDCREWHYQGKVYSAAPLPLLVESLMDAITTIDEMPPAHPQPLESLPQNLVTYFENKKGCSGTACC